MRKILIILLFFLCSSCLDEAAQRTSVSTPGSQEDDADADEEVSDISSLSFEESGPLLLTVGESRSLTLNTSSTDEVHWYSEASGIVSVSSGTLTALSSGLTTVSATVGKDSVSIDIIVDEAAVTLKSLAWHQSDLSKSTRTATELTLDADFSDGTSYRGISIADFRNLENSCDPYLTSDDESVAIILQDGALYPVDMGKANLGLECGSFSDALLLDVPALPTATSVSSETLENIVITVDPTDWATGQSITLTADVTYDSGTVSDVSRTFVTPNGNIAAITWSANEGSMRFDNGRATLLSYGDTTLEASLEDQQDNLDVTIKRGIDVLSDGDVVNRFLSSDDNLTFTYGTNGGFGSAWEPTILYGTPWTGGTDVVSLGGGGSLLIELNGYVIVDGVGPDFTLFENAQYLTGYDLFAERARISVSLNGTDFYSYDCDVDDTDDQIYEGCAGIAIVNATEVPYDPSVSGGDIYDLSDVGLSEARYILIEDLDTCVSGDPTYPLCATASTQGFDLDAMVILNGVYE